MHFLCKFCRGIVEANDLQAGEEVQCGHCNEVVRVPAGKFAAGSVIGGDFCIEREIAKGGMGVVYLAKQISLDRPAALKILQPHLVHDPMLVQGLILEARAAAKLNHPNIVQAYAVGEDDGVFYFAMEFVDGPTMKSVLKDQSIIPARRAAEIIRQIAEALACAWDEQKLTHRDLKPDNIIMNSSGRAKLADLGLSHVAGADKDHEDSSEEVLGTPQYISPEQLTGAPVDNRSDLYSLGATFFQFVTGRFPYVGKNADEIVRQHVEGTLTPPAELNPQVPEAVSRIIVKLMDKRPENRYQSAQELVRDIDAFLNEKPVSANGVPAAAASKTMPQPVRIGTQSSLLRAPGAGMVINAPTTPGGVKLNMPKPAQKPAEEVPAPTTAVPQAAPQEVKPAPGRAPVPLLKKPGVKPAPAPAPAPASTPAPAEAAGKAADGAAASTSMPGWNKGPKPKSAGMTDAQKQKLKVIIAIVLFALAGVFAFINLGGMDMVYELLGKDKNAAPATETPATTGTAAAPAANTTQPAAPAANATAATPTPAAPAAEPKPETPPPPQLQTSNMRAMAEELIKDRPRLSSADFLNRCDRFFMQFRDVDMAKETVVMQRLAPLYAQAEEESRAPEARQRRAALRSDLIAGRREADARIRGTDAQSNQAAQQVQALNAENQQRLENRTREFLAQLATARAALAKAFIDSIMERGDAKWQAAWTQYSPVYDSRWPELTDAGKKQADADTAFIKSLETELPQALARTELFRQNLGRVSGAQWQSPENDYMKMTGIVGDRIQFQSLLKSDSKELKLADIPEASRQSLATAVDRRTGEPGSIFFAMLCQGVVDPAMATVAPEGFWKNNFAELSRNVSARP